VFNGVGLRLLVKVKMQESEKMALMGGCCPTDSWCKTGQIGGLGSRAHAVSVPCCPIEVGKLEQSEAIPYHPSNDGEQSGKTMRPLTLEGDKAQQDVEQHRGPKLPAYGMLGVSEEVADFEGLLDLFEEGFDAPSATIQITDTGRCPLKVVGQKDHSDPFAVDLYPGGDATQALRILHAGLVSNQSNLVIADDVPIGSFQSLAANAAPQVVLGTGDPKDTAFGEVEEVGEVNVGLVEDGDLSGLKPGTQRHSSDVVMMGGLLDDSEGREEGLQVQTQMHFGGSLAATVFSPVHAVGHQSDGGGIHRMNRPFEAAGQPTVTTGRAEPRTKRLKMPQNAPKQFLHHVAVAVFVGVRERIAGGCNRATNRSQFGSVMAKAIAHVVQSDRMGQLGEQKTHNVTPRREGAGLLVYAMLARKFLRQVRRDEFAKLMQCAAVVFGRRYLFHASDSLVGIRRRPPYSSGLDLSTKPHPMG